MVLWRNQTCESFFDGVRHSAQISIVTYSNWELQAFGTLEAWLFLRLPQSSPFEIYDDFAVGIKYIYVERLIVCWRTFIIPSASLRFWRSRDNAHSMAVDRSWKQVTKPLIERIIEKYSMLTADATAAAGRTQRTMELLRVSLTATGSGTMRCRGAVAKNEDRCESIGMRVCDIYTHESMWTKVS